MRRVLARLRQAHGGRASALRFHDPWELLVAALLSAQTTDARVNKVTPALFARFPNPAALARASAAQVEPFIRSLGLHKNKAKALVGCARAIVADHHGTVPDDREELKKLPGVGHKTAGVVLAFGFGRQVLPVDTHVGRVARRLGFSRETDPTKVEHDLTALAPPDRLAEAHHLLIWHGRLVCQARAPLCPTCPVHRLCPYPAGLKR
ncbi:MAG: endonuclease III [Pseudomonadota bacterium]